MNRTFPGIRSRLATFLALAATLAACTNEWDDEAVGSSAASIETVPPAQQNSVLYQAYQAFLNRPRAAAVSSTGTDTLREYAARCDIATGIHVPAFNCDVGTEVPGQGSIPAGTLCDRPNVLNGQCDPGSKFQVLVKTADAAAVAHCRKVGLPIAGSTYGDIAVIQYNKKNGAVCFYQALTNLPGQAVAAPSEGEAAWRWYNPMTTEGIGCTGCHDSGGFIRSPYLAQLTTLPNVLPSTSAGFDNNTTRLKYVGRDFAFTKSWSITAPPAACPGGGCLACNTCHRLAVNNRTSRSGTAANFANVATARTQSSKVPHSPSSPIWMRPGQIFYSAEAEASATNFQTCANGFSNSGFTTPPAGCGAQALGVAWNGLSPAQVWAVSRSAL